MTSDVFGCEALRQCWVQCRDVYNMLQNEIQYNYVKLVKVEMVFATAQPFMSLNRFEA